MNKIVRNCRTKQAEWCITKTVYHGGPPCCTVTHHNHAHHNQMEQYYPYMFNMHKPTDIRHMHGTLNQKDYMSWKEDLFLFTTFRRFVRIHICSSLLWFLLLFTVCNRRLARAKVPLNYYTAFHLSLVFSLSMRKSVACDVMMWRTHRRMAEARTSAFKVEPGVLFLRSAIFSRATKNVVVRLTPLSMIMDCVALSVC